MPAAPCPCTLHPTTFWRPPFCVLGSMQMWMTPGMTTRGSNSYSTRMLLLQAPAAPVHCPSYHACLCCPPHGSAALVLPSHPLALGTLPVLYTVSLLPHNEPPFCAGSGTTMNNALRHLSELAGLPSPTLSAVCRIVRCAAACVQWCLQPAPMAGFIRVLGSYPSIAGGTGSPADLVRTPVGEDTS